MKQALLLRGVNVGGHNRLGMVELRSAVEELGGRDVRTYIQSGNVVCRGAPGLAAALEGALSERFGIRSPVVARTAEQLAAILERYPFDVPLAQRHVYFLAHAPDPARVASLSPDRSPGDRYAVVDADVYVHLPNGVARTRLTNDWFDTQLATSSTARNWNTVVTLCAWLAEP